MFGNSGLGFKVWSICCWVQDFPGLCHMVESLAAGIASVREIACCLKGVYAKLGRVLSREISGWPFL